MPSFVMRVLSKTKIGNRASASSIGHKVRASVIKESRKIANKMKKDFESTVGTWSHDVSFTIEDENRAGGDMAILIYTTDEVYGYLNEGTSVRWAVMSKDFEPKTKVRYLGSFPGSGYVVLRGKGQMRSKGFINPKPGIEARKWTTTVVEKYDEEIAELSDKVSLEVIKSILE